MSAAVGRPVTTQWPATKANVTTPSCQGPLSLPLALKSGLYITLAAAVRPSPDMATSLPTAMAPGQVAAVHPLMPSWVGEKALSFPHFPVVELYDQNATLLGSQPPSAA